MSTITRKPSKPWRVYGRRLSTDYRSQRAAYDSVKTLTQGGVTATVYHWEDDRWQLYEVIEPLPSDTGDPDQKASGQHDRGN